MAHPVTTGPAYFHAGIGPNYAPVFLGTATRGVRIQVRRYWEPIYNDIAGLAALDWMYEGQEGIVSCDLSRFDEAVYELIAAMPRSSSPGSVPGIEQPGDIGTMMVTEGFAFPIWVEMPYGLGGRNAKPALADQPPAYHFFAAMLAGPDDFGAGAVQNQQKRLIFQCFRTTTINSQLGATFGLYDFSTAGLGGLD